MLSRISQEEMEVIQAQMIWDTVMKNIQKLQIHDEMVSFMSNTTYPVIQNSPDPFKMLLLVLENVPVIKPSSGVLALTIEHVVDQIVLNLWYFAGFCAIAVTDEQVEKLNKLA